MQLGPSAFMSYVRDDDKYGKISAFRERLSDAVRMYTGEEFPIFQDRNDILFGQSWKRCIEDSLNAVTFLLPIVTPSFFRSPYCRSELERFLDREKKLGRDDLVLPVYWVDCPLMNVEEKRIEDSLAMAIAERYYADWRRLRNEDPGSRDFAERLEAVARQICAAIERVASVAGHRLHQVETSTAGISEEPEPGGERAEPSIPRSADARPADADLQPQRMPPVSDKVVTLVVDPWGQAEHTTIRSAIHAAGAGDIIVVRPGVYNESLTLDKPLEVIGDGDVRDVVVQAAGTHTLVSTANMGRVANITLLQMGGGNWCGVDIAQGRLEVEGCDISSNGLACVAIHNGANPRLWRNRIHSSKGSGVYVYDDGRGILEDNDIYENAYSGVVVRTGGNPTLRRNRIRDGKQVGVFVGDNGKGVLEDNDMFGNGYSGVEIRSGGDPMLRRNRIHDGLAGGVYVWDNGQGTLEDNEIFGNCLSGIAVRTGANPTLRRNRIRDGKQSGIYVSDEGRGVFEDNDIFGNAFSGVEIRTSGLPTLRWNRIRDGHTGGVCVLDEGLGLLEENDIFGNKYAGVAILGGGNPTLRRNHIHHNGQDGAYVSGGGLGLIEDNELSHNLLSGVAVLAACSPQVLRNRMRHNRFYGVFRNGDNGTFDGNQFEGNARGPWGTDGST
jgi:F-box protein 11